MHDYIKDVLSLMVEALKHDRLCLVPTFDVTGKERRWMLCDSDKKDDDSIQFYPIALVVTPELIASTKPHGL